MIGLERQLTDKQALFVECLVKGLDKETCAEQAGYAIHSQTVATLMGSTTVIRAIEKRTRALIQAELGPEAIRTLGELVRDKEVKSTVRRQAAKDLAGIAGYVAPKAPDHDVGERSLSSMSAAELASLISKLEGEAASRAKDVSAPNAPEADSDLADMLS